MVALFLAPHARSPFSAWNLRAHLNGHFAVEISDSTSVIPAQEGIQRDFIGSTAAWIPACAGMTSRKNQLSETVTRREPCALYARATSSKNLSGLVRRPVSVRERRRTWAAVMHIDCMYVSACIISTQCDVGVTSVCRFAQTKKNPQTLRLAG